MRSSRTTLAIRMTGLILLIAAATHQARAMPVAPPVSTEQWALGRLKSGQDIDLSQHSQQHELDGLTYDALSGKNSGLAQLANEMNWRLSWLPRNSDKLLDVAPDSYKEFAAALVKIGDLEDANSVLYQAQVQAQCAAFNAGHWLLCAKFFLMKWLVGYGIGAYTFRVLFWVMFLTGLGAYVLRYSEPAKKKGTIWCLEASLDRLLPIVELSPEFDDFFKHPETSQLRPWQVTFFAVIAILGWGLGLFLAAGLSGLAQSG